MSFIRSRDTANIPSIPEYFKGKTIFITGGSGFMGQALVEKLLYSCPELDRIYLLMRQKKGVPPEERLKGLYSSSCFDRLREESPTIFKQKVHIVPGDILELGLGLSEDTKALLINEIDIVFHVAASVKFNDPLTYAVKLNVRGTLQVIELAKQMENLSSYVHVSTCYSNTNYDVIEESLYPPLADWREVLEICENFDDEAMIRILTSKFLNGMPNTYVFTKQLAEHVVSEQRGKLPVVIIRPSIVFSSVEEPAPGWSNNFDGLVGLCIASGTGLKRSLYGTEDSNMNYVPLDICIKSFIVIAWSRGIVKLQDKDKIQIYNCCASKEDTIILKDFSEKMFYSSKYRYPLYTIFWDSKIPILTNVFILHYIITLFYSVIPAVFIDAILLLLGKKTRLLKLQRKIYIADLMTNYFMSSRNWILKNENFLKVRENIKEEDRQAFYYSTEQLYESDYLDRCAFGGKKYLLNEDVDDMSRATANAFRMKILDRFVKIVFFGCIFWWVVNTRYFGSLYQMFVKQ